MITNKDARLLAEYLVRWAESELSSGKALANGDDHKHRHDDRDSEPRSAALALCY
jgi:hypothetical protein